MKRPIIRKNLLPLLFLLFPVFVYAQSVPSAPPQPTQTQYCGYTTLTRGVAPKGETYYWQTSSTGTSTSNSSSTYDVTTSGNVYLRSYNGTYWSSATTISVTVKTVPAVPVANDETRCGTGEITFTATCATSGATIKWYNGGVESGSGSTFSDLLPSTCTYTVKSYLNGCYSAADNVTGYVKTVPANPSTSSTSRCGAGTLTLAASTTTSGADIQWYDGATYLTTGTSYAPTLSSTKTYTVKSHLNGCYSSDRTATGTINPIPNAPVANDIFRCDGGAVTLTATCSTSGATIKWYDGSTYLADGTSYGDLLTATKSYNVKSYLNGCYSLADAVTAEIRTIPTVPNATGASRCGSGSISLSATPVTAGSEVKWYDGTTLLQTGNTYAPNVTATKTYTVKAHLNSCYSTARDVTATVKTVPANPVGVSGENCGTGTVSLSASTTTSGATIQWYDGITYLTSGNSYTTSNLASTKSYISKACLDGCYSADVNVTATIKTVPNTPTTVGDAICGTGLVPLSATTTTSGASIVWYQGSTQVATGATYTPSVSSTTTYSVKSLLSGCYSSATNVTATVKPLPEAPVSSGNWRCGTGTLSLTATCATSGAAIQWYDGATLKNTGTTYTTPSLSADKTYTLISEKDGCQSLTNGSSLADIRVVPANPVATDVARCSSGTVSLSATCATSGATIKWYNGTTFLADGTSYDDLISTTQSYNVKSYLNGCYSSSADVATATVNALPNANAGADQSVCSGSSKTLTGTGGTSYLWSPATGLSSTTAASPTASPTATTTYTVTVTDANGCSKSDNVVITVNALPSASIAVSETSGLTNNDGTTCSGASLTLTASGGATYLWSTGQSTSSAVFSPTTTTAYTVTVTDANLCASSATRNITVNALPTPTFTAQATSVCNNSTGNVYTTQASKSSYVWVIPAGGTVTLGGTPTSNTATITWDTEGSKAVTVNYTDANGCTASSPVTSNITVKPLPQPLTVDDERCGAGTLTLTSGSTITGSSLVWYDGATQVGTGESYTTPSLTATKTYSVKATKDGCTGSSSNVTATIKTQPNTPVITPDKAYACGRESISFTASNVTAGSTLNWTLNGGNSKSGTTIAYSGIPAGANTVQVIATIETCTASKAVSFTGRDLPTPPSATDVSRVDAGSVTIVPLYNPEDEVRWYLDGSSTILATGGSYSPTITNTTVYEMEASDSYCLSVRSHVTATVVPLSFTIGVSGLSNQGTISDPFMLGGEANQNSIQMTCNTNWQLLYKPDWITVNKTSGTGNDVITMSYPASVNQNPLRGGYLKFTAGTTGDKELFFRQNTKTFAASFVESEFATTETSEPDVDISLSPPSNSLAFAINTDIANDYQVEITDPSGENWLYKYVKSATENKLYLDYATNRDVNPRTGTLTFKYGDIVMQQFNVEQKAVQAWSTATYDRNFVQTTAYGENGRVLGQSITYSDNLGKSVQSVARNMSQEGLIVSQTLYDAFGRPEASTMPIPVAEQTLDEVSGFASPLTDYDYQQGITTWQPLPDDLVLSYYSNTNTKEPFVPHDETPYSRVEYSTTIPGAVRKSYMAGDATFEQYTTGFTVNASHDELLELELSKTKGVNLTTLTLQTADAYSGNEFLGMTKTVSRDVLGKESVTYTDAQGQVIATCMSGNSGAEDITVTYKINSLLDPDGNYIDIHLPKNRDSYLVQKATAFYHEVIDLIEDEPVTSGTSQAITLVPGFYRIFTTSPTEVEFDVTTGYKYYSFNAYDEAGRLTKSLSPKDVEELSVYAGADLTQQLNDRVSRNTYNTLGWLLSSYSQDEGLTEYIYRRDGNIRFSQNEQQRNDNKFSYTNYDKHGRIVEVGEFDDSQTATTYFLQSGFVGGQSLTEYIEKVYAAGEYGMEPNTNIIPASTYLDQTFTLYDKADPNGPGNPKFLRGKVAKTWNNNTATWYSYTYDGLVEWVIQEIKGMDVDNDGLTNDLVATNGIEDADDLAYLDYTYDYNGNVTEVTYSSGIERLLPGLEGENQYARDYEFTHYYQYDLNDRLEAVYTQSKKDEKQLQARYYYYPHGPLKRVELADNLQGTDYVYTIQGWLKSINYPNPGANDPGKDGFTGKNAEMGTDVFGMTLDYYSGDYTRTGTNIASKALTNNYDGNIANQRWRNSSELDNTKPGYLQNAYSYYYDERNYLARANYSLFNASVDAFGSGSSYSVYGPTAGSNIVYDANGNIKSLSRKGANGEVIDAFTYTYYSGLNQLEYIIDNSVYTLEGTTDLKAQGHTNYLYNHIGQMTANKQDGHYFTYDVYGKTKTIYNNISFAAGTELATYEYDDRGFRVKKTDYNTNTTTWYVRDVSGNMITTYTRENTAALQRTEVPVYGSGRLGMATCNATGAITAYTYELTDHLGNVRATVGKNASDGTTQLLTATDYFPFGMELPGRTYRSTNAYRFGYQGQFAEKDQETGYNQFEARLYDARIGRWLTKDPAGQFWSPYVGMANNPVSGVDPDGRKTLTRIIDANGNYHDIADGSNAVFQWFGDQFKFMGYGYDGYDGGFQALDRWIPGINKGGLGTLDAFVSQKLGWDEFMVDGTNYKTSNWFAKSTGNIDNCNIDVDLLLLGYGLAKMTFTAAEVAANTGTTALRQVGTALESVDDVMLNPSLVNGKSYAQVRGVLSESEGWVNSVMTKTRGADKGWVYRQVNASGQPTGKLIQYHPGSVRHFEGNPYWKVSNGSSTFRFPAGN